MRTEGSQVGQEVNDALFQKFGRMCERGTVLFQEGQPGREMFVIQSGKVTIAKKVRDAEKVLATLGAGEFFGEMAIISSKPRNATATVVEEARLLVIDPKTFEAMVRGNAEIAVRMIKKLADRLADADAQIEGLLLPDPPSRVVYHLLYLCQSQGRASADGTEVSFCAKDAPRDLGVGESAVRLLLDGMSRGGLVRKRDEETLTIPDPAALVDYLTYLEMKWKFGDL